ncbi:MAG: UDP-N-acetylmuramoyl-tripeptide--D-alanyl-D-alanine ligase [Planctomycetes bacterium]|nr:UDP-N-acetylmuramoyl-tripeptide--D-alanyl-D-alanine ligase [Planctomycetota bacterium]
MDPIPLREIAQAVGGKWLPMAGSGAGKPPIPPLDRAVTGVSTDSRTGSCGALFVPVRGPRHNGHDFIGDIASTAAASLVEEGEKEKVLARVQRAGEGFGFILVPDAIRALEQLAAWYRRRLTAQVIAVTGSAGKTTVKEFLGQILSRRFPTVRAQKSFNNRFGVAHTLLSAGRSTRFLVVEMGTSAPGEIASLSRMALPDYVVITSIGQAHLQGLGDLHGVVRAKAEIFDGLRPGGLAFLPSPLFSEEHFLKRARAAECEVVRFGWRAGEGASEARGGYWITRCEPRLLQPARRPGDQARPGFVFEVNCWRQFELPLPGRHNVHNALSAMAAAREVGMDWESVRAGIRELELPPLRLEISLAGGVTIVDDTYNANPSSLRAAVQTVRDIPLEPGGRWHLILGDLLELGGASREVHRQLGEEIARTNLFKRLWTVGEEAREAGAAASALGLAAGSEGVNGLERLAQEVREAIGPGDGILIKASRGVALERVAARLKELLSSPGVPSREESDRVLNPV